MGHSNTKLILLFTIVSVIKQICAFMDCYGTPSFNCAGQELICNDTYPNCTLTCDGTDACYPNNPQKGLAKYTCNGNNLCEIECNGYYSCQYFKIESTSNTKLTCNGIGSCYKTTLTVISDTPSDVNVNITCIGEDSCFSAKFDLNGNATLNQATLNCVSGDSACRSTNVKCIWDSHKCDVYCPAPTPSIKVCDGADMCCGGQSHGDTCNIWIDGIKETQVAKLPTQQNFEFDYEFSAQCTLTPTVSPSNAPSNAPSAPPTIAPSNAPSNVPSNVPSNAPSISPSNNPSLSPSKAPSTPPSAAPSFSPTARPTWGIRKRDIITNYVMHYTFGINNFSFPAAIDKCMNYTINGDKYVKFECVDAQTAQSVLYEDENCEKPVKNNENIAVNAVDFECNGLKDTFIKLHIFPNELCEAKDKRIIYVADSMCAPNGFLNDHSIFYCTSEYDSDANDASIADANNNNIYATLWYQNFDDECSIYGEIGSEYLKETRADCVELYNDYYFEISDCYIPIPGSLSVDLSDYNLAGYIILACIVGLPLLLNIIAFLAVHRKRKGADRPGFIGVFKFFSSAGDVATDAIFTLSLYALNNKLYIYSAIFTFGPHLLSILIGIFFIVKWRQNKSQAFISNYASSFDKVIVILSLVGGFYGAIDLLTSHLFHLNVLSFQLSINSKQRIMNMKIINNVLLENVPCLCIQYLFLSSNTNDVLSNGISISLVAAAFSVLGIVFGLLTVSSRICNGIMDKTRSSHVNNNISIQFEFKSNKPDIVKKYHIHTHFLLSDGLCTALKIQFTQIEIIHIQKTANGILITAKLLYLDNSSSNTIYNELQNVNSEMYEDFYKQCTDRIKINSTFVELNIITISLNNNDNNTNTNTGNNSQVQLTRSIQSTQQTDETPLEQYH